MLEFIGRGSAFNTREGNTSAFKLSNDRTHLLLFDCGENVFDRLLRSGILDTVTKIDVIMTHFHTDHCGSLSSLVLYMYYAKDPMGSVKVNVMFPQYSINRLYEYCRLTGCLDKCRIQPLMSRDMYRNENGVWFEGHFHHIQFMKTQHDPSICSYAYDISEYDTNDCVINRFFYSGDLNRIPNRALDIMKSGMYDEMYIDMCSSDYEGNVHLYYKKACEVIPHISRVYAMHIDPRWDSVQVEAETGIKTVQLTYMVLHLV